MQPVHKTEEKLRGIEITLFIVQDTIAYMHKEILLRIIASLSYNHNFYTIDNDVVLSMDHFETILKEVDEARSKWYFIGRGIDCTYADLEEINKYSSNGDRRCLLEMLKVRIQRGGLTSSMLCKSLRGGFVGRDDVAQKIEAINF